MLKNRSRLLLLCLLLSGCAHVRTFKAMPECWVEGPQASPLYKCIDVSGTPYIPNWIQILDLQMFPSGAFKAFNETCHE